MTKINSVNGAVGKSGVNTESTPKVGKSGSRTVSKVETSNRTPPSAAPNNKPLTQRTVSKSSAADSGYASISDANVESVFNEQELEDENTPEGVTNNFRNNSIVDITDEILPLSAAVISKELGNGRFGKVYLVEQRISENVQTYAFKTAQGKKPEEIKSNLKKLQHEVDVLTSLGTHPNIVDCAGLKKVEQEEGVLFGLIKGPELGSINNALFELLEQGDISFAELNDSLAYLESQKLNAMSHLELENIVHGDLKPSNFMWDSDSKLLKLIDFGQSARIERGEKVVCGHEDYAAPEALGSLQGTQHAVPAKIAIDSYALGQMQFMTHNYLLGGSGHAFTNNAGVDNYSPGQRTEKAFRVRASLNDYATPNADGSFKKPIEEELSFQGWMMHVSEHHKPKSFDELHDLATKFHSRQETLKPMKNYICQLMHPKAEDRATASTMQQHPWITSLETGSSRIQDIIQMAATYKPDD